MQLPSEPLDLALLMADHGVPVFPIALSWNEAKGKTDKRPLTPHGHLDASTDPDVVRRLFATAPRLRDGEAIGYGMRPGAAGLVVIDADQHPGGADGVTYARESLCLPPHTFTVATATGEGRHYFLRKRDVGVAVGNHNGWSDHGVDVRADDGWVVGVGTSTPWGSWTVAPNSPDFGQFAMVPLDKWQQLSPSTSSSTDTAPSAGKAWQRYDPARHDALLHPATLKALEVVRAEKGEVLAFRERADGDPYLDITCDGHSVSATLGYVAPGILNVFSSGWPGRAKGPQDVLLQSWPGPDEEAADASSWLPADLTDILDGNHRPEEATLLVRGDGVGLLYRGRTHSFHGESESGKSLVAQAECSSVLSDGGRVLYIDCESDAASVVGRLRAMGAPKDALRERLTYIRPDEGLTAPGAAQAFYAVLSESYDLAVIDGVTEALSLLASTAGKPEEQVAEYDRLLPRRIASRTGAAVVQVDHVTKSTDGRGRFALGSQHKLSALTGAAYLVEVAEPLGLGMRGVVVLRVAKDRPGTVRPQCGPWRTSDRTQEAARIVMDATTPGTTVVSVEAPATRNADASTGGHSFRPTVLMERVSDYLAQMTEPVSGRAITENVQGKGPAIRTAVEVLVEEGYVRRQAGPRGALHHTLLQSYRQDRDPLSDTYTSGDALNPLEVDLDTVTATATASPTMSGDAGRSQNRDFDRVPGHAGTRSGHSGTRSPKQDLDEATTLLQATLGAEVVA